MAQKSKKDHIIATALPLLLEKGFKGTSIDMVVKACGVSKPTVYNHFSDKGALFREITAEALGELIQRLHNDDFAQLDLPAAVRARATALVGFAEPSSIARMFAAIIYFRAILQP